MGILPQRHGPIPHAEEGRQASASPLKGATAELDLAGGGG